MKLGKIIRKKRMERGISQSRLAREAGISNNHMNLIELEKVDNIGMHTLSSIAKVLGLDISELMQEGQPPPPQETHPSPDASLQLPLLGQTGLGAGHNTLHFDVDGYPVRGAGHRHPQLVAELDDKAYAVTVGDDSMYPIGKGYRLAVNPDLPVRSGDPVVVYLGTSDEFLFREYQESHGLRLLKPYHATHDPIVIPDIGRTIIHRVFAFFPPQSENCP